MSNDEIIRRWKAEDNEENNDGYVAPANPAGEVLSEEELESVEGGVVKPMCELNSDVAAV